VLIDDGLGVAHMRAKLVHPSLGVGDSLFRTDTDGFPRVATADLGWLPGKDIFVFPDRPGKRDLLLNQRQAGLRASGVIARCALRPISVFACGVSPGEFLADILHPLRVT
jgi:hypothetical protein